MKSMLGVVLAFTLVAFPQSAQASPLPGARAERLIRDLGLTEAQLASIHAIREKHRPDLLLRRDAARQSGLALRTALGDVATPRPRLQSLHDQASAARFEWMLARRSIRQEIRAVLTPEQRERAAELRGLAQARRREHLRHAGPLERMAG